MKLEKKVAFITGGTSGIGLETAKLFRAQGARIAVVGSKAKRLREAEKDLGGAALIVLADLRKVSDIERAVEETRAQLGRIDVVFANAGAGTVKPLEAVTAQDIEDAAIETPDRRRQALPLLDPMAGLIDWADRRYSDIHAARARFDPAPNDGPEWLQR